MIKYFVNVGCVCFCLGKHGDRWSPTQEIHITFPLPPSHTSIDPPADPEALIVAMERVTVLFDRLK